MSETTYRIKPLLWTSRTGYLTDVKTKSDLLGCYNYYVSLAGRTHDGDRYEWIMVNDSCRSIDARGDCNSIDHGKQLAEQHWHEQLKQVLEETDDSIS